MNSLSARLVSVLAITHSQTGVSWHFDFKDKVLTIEL